MQKQWIMSTEITLNIGLETLSKYSDLVELIVSDDRDVGEACCFFQNPEDVRFKVPGCGL